ncbi:MAG: hypothetical protein ACOYL7_18875 [Caldilinea sp.]|jgi:hypothetical protein
MKTYHAQTHRILDFLSPDLDAILSTGQPARITLNIGGGGNVRIEVSKFRDVPCQEERVERTRVHPLGT